MVCGQPFAVQINAIRLTASNIARLRNDQELAKEALRQDGTALRHVSDTLQGCKDIVTLAVCQAGCALRWAQQSKLLSRQPQIRADTDVNRAAVKANGRAIASDRSFWWAPCEDILADAVHTHANTIGAIESQGGLHQMCPPPSGIYGGACGHDVVFLLDCQSASRRLT